MKCAISDYRFDLDDPEDEIYDVFLAHGRCKSMPGASKTCYAQADCADKTTCMGWNHAVDLAKGATPVSYAYTSSGLCVTVDPKKKSFGDHCGALAKEALCNSGRCFNTTNNAGKLQKGYCSDLCGSRSECTDKVKLYGYDYRGICRSVKYTYNATIPPHDDLYLPACRLTNGKSTLVDCSKTKTCSDASQACRSYSVAFGPDKAITTEYWCTWNQNSSNNPPVTGNVGDPCDLESNDYLCKGGYCLRDTKAGTGYCSGVCNKDSDCGSSKDGMFCDKGNMNWPGIPRNNANVAGVVPMCRKQKSCISCSYDYQCGGDYRCTNIGGTKTLTNQRCAPSCQSDKDCAASDGGIKCQAAKDKAGQTLTHKVCTPTCL
jgi:hypothetical protein